MSADFVQRGRQLVEQHQFQEAVKVCRLGLLAHPTTVEGRLVLASALLSLARYDEVLAEMRVALELDGQNAQAMALRGEALLRKGDAVQATEVLGKARELVMDPRINALYGEALGASGDRRRPVDFGAAEETTRHYGDNGRGPITESPSVSPHVMTPSPAELAVGERTGTIEIDPALVAYERRGAEHHEEETVVGGPLGGRGGADLEEEATVVGAPPSEFEPSDVMELSDGDLIITGAGLQPAPEDLPPDGEFDSYDSLDESTEHFGVPPRARPGDFDEQSTRDAARRPQPRHAPAPGGAHPPPMAAGRLEPPAGAAGPDLEELFPDDESVVAPAEVFAGLAPSRQPGPPGPGGDMLDPDRSPNEDMRMIRAGLGLDPEGSEPGKRKTIAKAMAAAGRAPAAAAPPERGKVGGTARGKRKARADSRTWSVHKQRRPASTRVVLGYVLLTVVVLGAGVVAGLKIRALRLDREIQRAEHRAAEQTRSDTYAGYIAARRTYERIVEARESPQTRALLARVSAALAAEFGEGLDDAEVAVDRIGDHDSADAAVARAYLAIATGDSDGAGAAAVAVSTKYPEEPLGQYLVGQAALLANRPDSAREAFRSALRMSQRPLFYIGLGRAEAELRRFSEAKVAFEQAADIVPGHPSAVIGRARVLARGGGLPEPPEPEAALEAVIEEGRRPLDQQTLGASPAQVARAALVLAEVELGRADEAGARRAVEEALKSRPEGDLRLSEELTGMLLRVGMAEAALAEAERAATRWPELVRPRVVYAEVLLAAGQPARAVEILDDTDISRDALALATRGRARLALGEIEPATSDLDSALAINDDLPEAVVARAELDLRIGAPRRAVARLQPLYEKSRAPAVGVVLARALRESGERAGARAILTRLVQLPNPGRAYLELARLERDEARFSEARAAYAKAIELSPNVVESRMEAALLALDTGDALGAREALDQLARDAPDDGRVLVEAARVHTLTGSFEEAWRLLDAAEETASAPRWQIARERARLLLGQRDPAAAIAPLERSIGLEPEDGESRLLLLEAHILTDNGQAARRTMTQVLKKFPGQAEAQMAIGRVDSFFGRTDTALKAYGKALAILTRNNAVPRRVAEAHYWTGRVHYSADDLDAALTAMKAATDLDPSYADAHLLAGLIELSRKSYGKAAESLQRVVEIDPVSMPDAWFYLGEAAFNARKPDTARKAFEAFLELSPGDDLAAEAKKYLAKLR